jgi:hypothetical protein
MVAVGASWSVDRQSGARRRLVRCWATGASASLRPGGAGILNHLRAVMRTNRAEQTKRAWLVCTTMSIPRVNDRGYRLIVAGFLKQGGASWWLAGLMRPDGGWCYSRPLTWMPAVSRLHPCTFVYPNSRDLSNRKISVPPQCQSSPTNSASKGPKTRRDRTPQPMGNKNRVRHTTVDT